MKETMDRLVLDRIVRAGLARRITRRHFMQHAVASGLGVGAAATLWTGQVAAQTPSRGGTFRVGNHDANTTDAHDPANYLTNFMIQLAHTSRSYLTQIAPDGNLVGRPKALSQISVLPFQRRWQPPM